MSLSQFSRCASVNESNIPVSKRLNTGTKKSKRCVQLPELQKYIETIIKASNEYDSEDTSISDRDRFPKERKFGKYSLYKGLDSKTKQEKIKNHLNMNRSNSNIKTKTPVSEAVSRGVKFYNNFALEFEDPRNWKLDKTKNLGPSVKIEKFLKKFYPNPYHLETVNEFKKSKNEYLRERTLSDVDISKANIHAEVGIERKDTNDLMSADVEIKPCKRGNRDLNLTPDTSLEKCTQSSPRCNNNSECEKNCIVSPPCFPALAKANSGIKCSNSTSNTSSRASSLESLNEMLHKNSQMNLKKKKYVKPNLKALKRDRHSDYDIGKLKLLSLTDSEHSLKKLQLEKTILKDATGSDEIVCQESSKLCEEVCKSDDLNDMKEIYDIMYKATESFLYISSKNDSQDCLKNLTESRVFSNCLNNENVDVGNSKGVVQLNSDKTGNEIYRAIEQLISDKGLTSDENTPKLEESNSVGQSLINILLKEDKFEYRSQQEPERDNTLSNYDAGGLSEPSLGEDSEQKKKEKQNFANEDQKEGEDVDFMYGCVKKFCNKENPSSEEEGNTPQEATKTLKKIVSCRKIQKGSATNVNYEKPTTSNSSKSADIWLCQRESSDSLLTKNFPNIKEIQSKYSAALDEINKKQLSRTRCKRKPPQGFTRNLTERKSEEMSCNQNPGMSGIPPTRNSDALPLLQSHETINENSGISAVLTVEGQNELGGYTEDTHEFLTSANQDTRIPKPIFPPSVKQKKSSTGKTLKDVLEAEEKLFSDETKGRETEAEEKHTEKDLTSSKRTEQGVVQNDSTKVYSHLGDFIRPSSNFVICVNSFPRNLRSVTAIKSTLLVPLSASLGDMRASFNNKQFYSMFPLKNLSLTPQTRCYVLEHIYNFKQEVLFMVNTTVVEYNALPVCLKVISNLSTVVEEFSLKSSECMIEIIIKLQQSEEADNAETIPEFEFTQSPAEDGKPVKALIEAIEEAEEKVFLMEQSTHSGKNLYYRNSDGSGLSTTEMFNSEFLNKVDVENDRKKIHELLLRTFNLQKKLQRYLQKITYVQAISLSCPLVQHDVVASELKGEFDLNPDCSLPVVHWHLNLPEPELKLKEDESVAVRVVMVDRETSYDPPAEEGRCEKAVRPEYEFKSAENDEPLLEDPGNDDVDRSSICSFKSSNDFSESSEVLNVKKEVRVSEGSNKKLFKKIFSELESFKPTVDADKSEKHWQRESNTRETEESIEKRLAQYDARTPAKVLRTVFRGKKSSTELTIGLKDVPMTKVGNISVEKTKFSPNHTKISICITKENSEEPPGNFSSYIFDRMRPCLSTCLTEYSRLRDDDSKGSQSLNEESEDDEDDYKSVVSTLDNCDSEADDEDKSEAKNPITDEPLLSKSFTKHRFDFYQKMNTELDSNKSKQKSPPNSLCRYKELEPLKQAFTDMQIRMRGIKRDVLCNSNDYYERALKLAKMSAGFCQSCGNRAVIPNDTFGYYKTLLPRRYTHHRRNRHFRTTIMPNHSFYSIRSSNAEVSDHYCDLGLKHSSFMLNPRIHSSRTVFRNSLQDMPVLFERI